MCNQYIWWPLENLKTSEWYPELDVFEQRRQDKHDENRDPNIRDFIWICRQGFFKKLLAHRKLGRLDTQFLTQCLPESSRKLMDDKRNLAEHKLDKIAERNAVEAMFKGFLGIGQPGILPELAPHRSQATNLRQVANPFRSSANPAAEHPIGTV